MNGKQYKKELSPYFWHQLSDDLKNKNDILSTPIEYLKGVGPVKGDILRKERDIHTYEDLLTDFPFRYIDRSVFTPIAQIGFYPDAVQVKGRLIDYQKIKMGHRYRLEAMLKDETGQVKLVWFQQIKWIEKILVIDAHYIVYGRVNKFKSLISIPHPEMEIVQPNTQLKGSFEPVYHSTEKLNAKGLDTKGRRVLIKHLIAAIQQDRIKENLPAYILNKMNLMPRQEALAQIHFPKDKNRLNQAQNRIKFEELFLMQLKLLFKKVARKEQIKGHEFANVGSAFNRFYKDHLAFELTGAQKRVLKEIRRDLGSGRQMNRLLQGDVGSGKTIVALMSMLMALDNGYQACIIAPTEILARQHFESITRSTAGMDISVGFLSGSIKGRERKEIFTALAEGTLDILIGTHAVLEDPVIFHNLGLAITDEQHRFGVAQRAKLWSKNKPIPPHILVMTATPIPRTLSMTLYGDLDVSVIDEMPPGRKAIITVKRSDAHRFQMIEFLRTQIAKGRQVYIVYPLIEESEKLDLKNLESGYEMLLEHFPRPKYQVSIVHGRMKSDVKDLEMKLFVEGKTHIMVATTVIEVGVDVSNASIMVIENAERFGLSQLHQLRGRVGRGAEQSYCILMAGYKQSKEGRIRLDTMVKTNDGFEIAEVDLKLRGPGNLEGTQQSGVLDLKLTNIARDVHILQSARQLVLSILDHDPHLEEEKHQLLKSYIEGQKKQQGWSLIS